MTDIFHRDISSASSMDEELNLKTSFGELSQARLVLRNNYIAKIDEDFFKIHMFGLLRRNGLHSKIDIECLQDIMDVKNFSVDGHDPASNQQSLREKIGFGKSLQ